MFARVSVHLSRNHCTAKLFLNLVSEMTRATQGSRHRRNGGVVLLPRGTILAPAHSRFFLGHCGPDALCVPAVLLFMPTVVSRLPPIPRSRGLFLLERTAGTYISSSVQPTSSRFTNEYIVAVYFPLAYRRIPCPNRKRDDLINFECKDY